jgi:hypothetical protein
MATRKKYLRERIHLRAEPVMQPLVNQICVVKTESRAPNEPLVWIHQELVFFPTNTKGCSAQVGTASWQDLEFVLLFASILRIMAQWTSWPKHETVLPFAWVKLSCTTVRGRFVAEIITTSELRTVHEQLHTGSARKCVHTLRRQLELQTIQYTLTIKQGSFEKQMLLRNECAREWNRRVAEN